MQLDKSNSKPKHRSAIRRAAGLPRVPAIIQVVHGVSPPQVLRQYSPMLFQTPQGGFVNNPSAYRRAFGKIHSTPAIKAIITVGWDWLLANLPGCLEYAVFK